MTTRSNANGRSPACAELLALGSADDVVFGADRPEVGRDAEIVERVYECFGVREFARARAALKLRRDHHVARFEFRVDATADARDGERAVSRS